MRIFIADKDKLTKFNLPEKIEDSFLVPYKEKNKRKEKYVTIESENESFQKNLNKLTGNDDENEASSTTAKVYSKIEFDENGVIVSYDFANKEKNTTETIKSTLSSIKFDDEGNIIE